MRRQLCFWTLVGAVLISTTIAAHAVDDVYYVPYKSPKTSTNSGKPTKPQFNKHAKELVFYQDTVVRKDTVK